ncbi:MAG: vitamin K epoxide reductase family protein [Planctomycetota bacterium]
MAESTAATENQTEIKDGGLPGVGWVACVIAAAAAGVSAYLTFISLRDGTMPAGCGAGSGCAQVLTSKWSKVAGVLPVSALALGAYAALIVGVMGSAKPTPGRSLSVWLTGAAAAAIIGAGLWFFYLQAAVIGAWCAWCMTGHGLGLLASVAALASVAVSNRAAGEAEASAAETTDGDDAPDAAKVATRKTPAGMSLASGSLVGLVGVMVVAMVQAVTPTTIADLALPKGRDFDVDRDGQRFVGVLDGQMQVGVGSLPHAGPIDAEAVALVMFDYACTHCRRHLATLDAYQAENPGAVVRVAIPVPLNSACNPGWDESWDEPAFADSCKLAELSFAVWQVDPEAWPAFDRWLWDRDMAADADEAAARAVEAVGGDSEALQSAILALRDAETLRPFGEAWIQFDSPLPVTLWPGGRYDIGAYDSGGAVTDAIGAIDFSNPATEAQDDG